MGHSAAELTLNGTSWFDLRVEQDKLDLVEESFKRMEDPSQGATSAVQVFENLVHAITRNWTDMEKFELDILCGAVERIVVGSPPSRAFEDEAFERNSRTGKWLDILKNSEGFFEVGINKNDFISKLPRKCHENKDFEFHSDLGEYITGQLVGLGLLEEKGDLLKGTEKMGDLIVHFQSSN